MSALCCGLLCCGGQSVSHPRWFQAWRELSRSFRAWTNRADAACLLVPLSACSSPETVIQRQPCQPATRAPDSVTRAASLLTAVMLRANLRPFMSESPAVGPVPVSCARRGPGPISGTGPAGLWHCMAGTQWHGMHATGSHVAGGQGATQQQLRLRLGVRACRSVSLSGHQCARH
jgi:hypothetical protein